MSTLPKTQVPIFLCIFCRSHSFKTIIGYWTHIRDRERLISDQRRLDEIKSSGGIWLRHLEQARASGHGTSRADPTWLKLQQISQGLAWDDVLSWRLGYNRGKNHNGVVSQEEADGYVSSGL